jgi:ATP-dependent exoDNAse (exonuclease V) alpha subunit
MASYHLSVKTVSRATGRSGPGAAAYRTASLIQCERDGTTHDYTRRSGVEASFIVAPPGAAWAQDRAALWNAVEAAEKRKDAKVAREYELALPHELAPEDRRALAEGFAREVVARFGVVADVAIHAPHRHGDERNWHAHVLTTTRVAGAEGLGAKTRELDVVQTSGPAVEALRELWAVQMNHALERIQSEARVDHRSYARQGEDQVATQHMGPAAAAMERKAARWSAERAQEGAGTPPEPVQEAPMPVLQPVAKESSPDAPKAAVRPSAGVSGAGLEPATRIGQRNAEIGERNRAVQAARAALDVARRALEGLERAAAAGQRWVSGLARGLGAQIAGEREERAWQAEQAAERQREALARDAAARLAEQERQQQARIAAEQAKPAITQEQRDAARQAGTWGRVEDIGRQAREADRARRGPDHERPGERQGPSMGR